MPDIFVGTFGDAMAEAATVVDELGRAFVAYTLDARGQVIGGWALTADFHRIEDVVLLVLAGEAPAPGTGVLLLSVDRDGLDQIAGRWKGERINKWAREEIGWAHVMSAEGRGALVGGSCRATEGPTLRM